MLIVNLYGGPGSGKSTLAAAIFSQLKDDGVSAELVTEFAKECAWEGRSGPLSCQPYMFGEQLWRLERLRDRGVEVAVTDSPILLNVVYAPGDVPLSFGDVVRHYHRRQNRIDVFLRRTKAFDPRGRFHTADQASELDGRILEVLQPSLPVVVPGELGSVPKIVNIALRRLGRIPSEDML